jgi:hypothetical protein
VAERPKVTKAVDVAALMDKSIAFEVKTAELPDERASRLRREEAEEAHKRLLGLIVHVFSMTIVAIACFACIYIAVAIDPKTDLPGKAVGILATIAGGAIGFIGGRASK